jgi:chromosome segregation ATPase
MVTKTHSEEISGLYQQVNESINHVLDLSSRIDERVKMLIEKSNDFSAKLEVITTNYSNLIQRIVVLESCLDYEDFSKLEKNYDSLERKMLLLDSFSKDLESLSHRIDKFEAGHADLQHFKKNTESNIKTLFDTIYKILITLGMAYVMYKLGLKE